MSVAINGGEKIPQNQAEVSALLEAYKTKNPEKFAAKEAKGEFEKLRKSLPDFVEPKLEIVVPPKEESVDDESEALKVCPVCQKEYHNQKRFDTHLKTHETNT